MRILPASTAVLLSLMLTACNMGDNDYSDDGVADSGIGLDKTVVVYETFAPSSGRSMLHAAASDGSAVHLLAPEQLSAASIEDYALSPAGTYVAYRTTPVGPDRARLYIANVSLAWEPMSGLIAYRHERADADVLDASWSTQGGRLAYRVGDSDGIELRIFDSTSNTTTAVVNFSRAPVLIEPEWLPWTRDLVYVADADTTSVGELFVTDANNLPSN